MFRQIPIVALGAALLGAASSSHAESIDRSEATVIWSVSHPKTGSVAQKTSGSDRFSLTFPKGPIVSGANIDLPPEIQTDGQMKGWGRWTIPARIQIEASEMTKDPATLKKRPARGWRLFATLRDGRVIEASKKMHGGGAISYRGDGQILQTWSAEFELRTNITTRREFDAFAQRTSVGVIVEVFPAEKPQLWRDVTELWLIDR